MAHIYTPGLKVVEKTILRKERVLPLPGEVLVGIGDKVKAEDIVARTHLPGNVNMINIANKLAITPSDIRRCMLKKEGDKVSKDELIAKSSSFFGLFKYNCTSPIDGEVESISEVTGQVVLREPPIPIEVIAYVDGVIEKVKEKEGVVVKTEGVYIQGIFGIGGEEIGEIVVAVDSPEEELKPESIKPQMKGKVVVGGSFVSNPVIVKAVEVGVKGIIAGGIDDQDLRNFLGYDLGVAITGSEEKGITLIITEGFGVIKMADKAFTLLKKYEGFKASINGATQIRAGVIRPEIIIPLGEVSLKEDKEEEKELSKEGGLVIGASIRIIRQPHFGKLGKVVSLPAQLQRLETEAKVRVVEIELESGEKLILPRANIELIEH